MPDPEESVRHQAVLEVLRRIPKKDYETLKGVRDSFAWFIPPYSQLGMVYPFAAHEETKLTQEIISSGHAQVLYLSPVLERAAWDIVLAAVTHELGHICLGHAMIASSQEEYDAKEQAVFDRLCAWGFDRQARKHLAWHRRRISYEKYLTAKLERELGDVS